MEHEQIELDERFTFLVEQVVRINNRFWMDGDKRIMEIYQHLAIASEIITLWDDTDPLRATSARNHLDRVSDLINQINDNPDN